MTARDNACIHPPLKAYIIPVEVAIFCHKFPESAHQEPVNSPCTTDS